MWAEGRRRGCEGRGRARGRRGRQTVSAVKRDQGVECDFVSRFFGGGWRREARHGGPRAIARRRTQREAVHPDDLERQSGGEGGVYGVGARATMKLSQMNTIVVEWRKTTLPVIFFPI